MAVFCITQKIEAPFSIIGQNDNFDIGYIESQNKNTEYFITNDYDITWTNTTPVIDKDNIIQDIQSTSFSFESIIDLIKTSQNNFCGFSISKEQGEIILFSSRFSRSQLFYIQNKKGFFFSSKVKELLPFSNKKLNLSSIFSTVKFGDSPDFETLISDIHCVPSAKYLKINFKDLIGKQLSQEIFTLFFKINYKFEGGDIKQTESLLDNMMKHISQKDIIVPLSGGIDSTLLSCIVDKHRTEKYPAYFMQFGDFDKELEFAKKAAKGTKAELSVFKMNESDFIESFDFQARNLQLPVGESSAIAMAHLFRKGVIQDKLIIDGTMADGCYGSRKYSTPLFTGIEEKGSFSQLLNEKIAGFLQLLNLPGRNSFHPRDAYIKDPYLQAMAIYTGPLSNFSFKKSKEMSVKLEGLWSKYYELIKYDNKLTEQDIQWVKYTVFKMIGYASKITTAKIDDLKGGNDVVYPFMWKGILEDQGKYSWDEKTKDGIIKSPLKTILKEYKADDFIFRKKVGLNSAFNEWVYNSEIRNYLCGILSSNNNLTLELIGKRNLKYLLSSFNKADHNINLNNLVLSLASIQLWANHNQLSL